MQQRKYGAGKQRSHPAITNVSSENTANDGLIQKLLQRAPDEIQKATEHKMPGPQNMSPFKQKKYRASYP
jgi:hypothetical protein